LLGEIERIADEFPAYGYRRITRELRRRGTVVNHKRVARVMREGHVAPARVRRFVATTQCAEDAPVFPNLVRDYVTTRPNQLWYADFTYIRLRTRFVFLAVLLDAWSRKVAGYALSPHLDARLPLAALDAALADWAPPPGLIQHSDRGVQPEFNRSSQHFDGRCGDADEEATVGSSRTWEDGLSGAPWHGPA
jgi:putative transposase